MFELLSIVCTAAALAQSGCMPDLDATGEPARPDTHEMRVAAGTWQLSYAGNGHDFDRDHLTEHWRRRAAQICAGDYRGHPIVQAQYPDAGYDAVASYWPVASARSYNVEAFGVAYCKDHTR